MNKQGLSKYIDYLISIAGKNDASLYYTYKSQDSVELIDLMETCDFEYQMVSQQYPNEEVLSTDEFIKMQTRERKLKQLLDV